VRVAFLTHNFPRHPGDAPGSFLLRLAVALRDVGVEVRVFAPSAPGYPASDAVEGVPVERFRYAPASLETIAYTGTMAGALGSWGGRLALGGLVAASSTAARRAVRGWRADVVHAHWWFPSGLAAASPVLRGGVPLVITMHGSDVRLAAGVAAARSLFAGVTARAARVTAVSRWLCAQAVAMAPALRCDVGPMPAATHLFSPDAAAPRDGWLFVGRLNAQKGIAHLVRALARQRHPERLTVVGDGPDAAALDALATELGVASRITWRRAIVPQSELADFYRRARALVVPSIDEGLGLVAVEAMLCETPVVAFASGGLPDVVVEGRTGWLVPPGDVDALAATLDRVVTAPELAELGREGRSAALATFAPEMVAARYRDVYAHAIAGRSPA
jgi:glycosyltransferase involved in cell wall biosynthesis